MNEEEIIERLYMLMRLEHCRNRCDGEGVYSDEEGSLSKNLIGYVNNAMGEFYAKENPRFV